MKRKLAILLVLIICAMSLIGCESWRRGIKSAKSDLGGGLDRTVTVYSYDGTVIKSWSGKFDVSESTNEVFFDDENGKRVIIHGGIVINEEN